MELMDLANFLDTGANYFVIIPICLGFFYIKHISVLLKILLFGLVLAFLQLLILKVLNINSSFIFGYILAAIDTIVVTLLISQNITSRTNRIIFLTVGLLLLLFIFIDSQYITCLNNFGISTFIVKIFIVISAFITLNYLFKINLETEIFEQPIIWICFGLIFNNLLGSFEMFSLAIMNYSQNLVLQYYILLAFVRIVMYLFFSYSFYLSQKIENN
jgi:hypothetical protein